MIIRTTPLAIALIALVSSPTLLASEFTIITQTGRTLLLQSQLDPLQINRIHSWEITVTDSNGEPVIGAEISVIGGMPAHDHGLPTQPIASSTDRPGVYVIEGIRFHMPGDWEMTFTINTPTTSDTGILEFSL